LRSFKQELDVRTPQVLIECRILTVALSASAEQTQDGVVAQEDAHDSEPHLLVNSPRFFSSLIRSITCRALPAPEPDPRA
jgi:hypothetical protein